MNDIIKLNFGLYDACIKRNLFNTYPFLKSIDGDSWLILAENGVKVYDWHSFDKLCKTKLVNDSLNITDLYNKTYNVMNMSLFFVLTLLKLKQTFNTLIIDTMILIEKQIKIEKLAINDIKYILIPVNLIKLKITDIKNISTSTLYKLNNDVNETIRLSYDKSSKYYAIIKLININEHEGELSIQSIFEKN